MTPERYADITRLCQAALELNVSQRHVFLAQACEGDDALRVEVETLLAADAAPHSFLISLRLKLPLEFSRTNSRRSRVSGWGIIKSCLNLARAEWAKFTRLKMSG